MIDFDARCKCYECTHRGVCKYQSHYISFLSVVAEIFKSKKGVQSPDCAEMTVNCKYFRKDPGAPKGRDAQTIFIDDIKEIKCDSKNSNDGVWID